MTKAPMGAGSNPPPPPKKKVTKERGGSVWGCGRFTYTPGHTLDHRWAFLCFLVGRFTEHFRPTGFVPARCRAREYQCSGCGSLGWAWTGIWERKTRETAVLAGFLDRLDYHFLFPLLLLSSPFFHTSISHTFSPKHYMYYVSHRCSRWISGSLGGGDQGQSEATRCPPSNTTSDAAIGQKRNIPTLLRRWLCPVTRVALCGLGSLHVEHGAAPGALRKRDHLWYSGITTTSLATLQSTNFKLYVDSFSNSFSTTTTGCTHIAVGRTEATGYEKKKKRLFFFLPASHESKESHT